MPYDPPPLETNDDDPPPLTDSRNKRYKPNFDVRSVSYSEPVYPDRGGEHDVLHEHEHEEHEHAPPEQDPLPVRNPAMPCSAIEKARRLKEVEENWSTLNHSVERTFTIKGPAGVYELQEGIFLMCDDYSGAEDGKVGHGCKRRIADSIAKVHQVHPPG